MKLKGIMETSLGGFLTFRGFADFAEIARVSEPDKAYQRDIDEKHNKELQDFLEKGEKPIFPRISVRVLFARR
ncbi:hypothetical protein IP364_02220 [Helicobacter winghamensis]|uniref:hypothetical protein n=1 Tax=Helicobacter winghamensis TaxID=157268 RepID=UPI00279CF960